MDYNAVLPQTEGSLVMDFGIPLTECNDISKLQIVAEKLWSLLDDIDTASDMFKPSDEDSYRRFYEYTMNKILLRGKQLESDGHILYLPNNLVSNPHIQKTEIENGNE